MKICHACKKEIEPCRAVGRRDVCKECRADLACCRNCTFYERTASRQCREPMAELVKDKDRANFCDYFSFTEATANDLPGSDSDKARQALDGLFRK